MDYSNTRRSVAQTGNPASVKYRELAAKDFARQLVKSKCAQAQDDSISGFTVADKSRSSCGSKGRVTPLEKIRKCDKGAKGTAELNPARQKKRGREQCSNNARSTRQLRRNERERGRKARLNAAFQVLRSVVPNNVSAAGSTDRKMTQVEILRLAKNYISNLTEMLKKDSDSYPFSSYHPVSH